MSKTKNQVVDVLVIGAGPSGTVSASILNKKGYSVKIVEKQLFPRFVIGESLLPRCMDNLDKAGFIDAISAFGFQKKFGAKFLDNERVSDFDFSAQFTKGWTWTWQVQRAKFDHLLAKEVEKNGVEVEYESAVTAVQFAEDGSSISTVTKKDGTTYNIEAKFIVDGSGYGRVLPRLLSLDKPSEFMGRTSLFCHVKPKMVYDEEEKDQILILVYTNEIWGWVIPFSDGTSSIGVVGHTEGIKRYEGTQEEKMRQWIQEVPALKSRFTDSELIFEPKEITGYASAVTKHFGKNFVLTGNAAEFIDPVFSSGVTFATESGALAAELIDKQLSGLPVDWQVEYTDYIQRGVDVFKTFVSSWYDGKLQKIFFSEQSNPEMRQQICSILAGYVWDLDNPFVKKHKRAVQALAAVL
ncbi:MAG TPA: NAD(P)/FAD-dependent oxidoreductase [Fulvivirga sp.]|nr:NAD(P)/FAD-dependent oxidoreductase [Fulvivirga sp.]